MSPADALWQSLCAAGGPVLLTGPVAPDGDSIGACLALQRVLVDRQVPCDVAGTASHRYDWLPGAQDMVPDTEIEAKYAVVVVLDGDRHRLTEQPDAAFRAAGARGIVDHHASTRPDGYDHAWLDAGAASTCEMLHTAFGRWGVELDAVLATLLYTGVVFDTGGFRYSNTSASTHRLAAQLLAYDIDHAYICARILAERRAQGLALAGAVYSTARFAHGGRLCVGVVTQELAERLGSGHSDLEGIVEGLVHTIGTDVAVLVIQRRDGRIKYSLRSRGQVDVAAIAQRIIPSGGGHAKAAGACIEATPEQATDRIIAAVGEALMG